MAKKFELKKLSKDMSRDAEYEMFQDIPAKENGSSNLCKGVPREMFTRYLWNLMAKEFQKISDFDTPTLYYIFYVQGIPTGLVGIRTKINKTWMKWCGNLFYVLRQNSRGKGYAPQMVKLALEEMKKLGYKKCYVKSSAGNIASQKTIEKCGAKLLKIEDEAHFFVFNLEK